MYLYLKYTGGGGGDYGGKNSLIASQNISFYLILIQDHTTFSQKNQHKPNKNGKILAPHNSKRCILRLPGADTVKSVHPGEQLREVTASQLADSIGVPDETMSRILDEKSGLTPNIAVRLGKFFGTSAEMWMNMQAGYDLEREAGRDVRIRRTVEQLVSAHKTDVFQVAADGVNDPPQGPNSVARSLRNR